MENKLDSIGSRKGKTFTGVVKSTKMNKTIIVEVIQLWRHPLYKKAVRRTRRFAAHNEIAGIAVGDHVTISETKPISKTKHFRIIEKIK